jgi:hypothetical protein
LKYLSSPLYEALSKEDGETRLLRLRSTDIEDADIECSLDTVKLDHDVDEYIALSYVWGDPNITEPIAINGHKLQVTTNLASALRHIRILETSKETLLWADAICKN